MRDYQKESEDIPGKKYSYNFDEYMRGCIIRTWEPFFKYRYALEVGCGDGELTKYIDPYFKSTFLDKIDAKDGLRLEDHCPNYKYDTIIMHNVLEHTDDSIVAIKKASTILNDGGRLFISVPNANAPSRQIAVNMGLIEHTLAVTDGEYQHGHRRTYNLETLCLDIKKSVMSVVKSGGVFFKPMANFQIDAACESGILSPEYMEGAYQLGEKYPDLCSTIYVICEKK